MAVFIQHEFYMLSLIKAVFTPLSAHASTNARPSGNVQQGLKLGKDVAFIQTLQQI